MNLSNVLHGSSNGTRTNALPYVPQNLGLFPRTTTTMLGLMYYPQRVLLHKNRKDRERSSQFSNMWQLSNLQIDSSVIQIVQSDVLRNSIDTTAAITNTSERGAAKVGRASRPERPKSVYTGRPRARRLGARARGFASSP